MSAKSSIYNEKIRYVKQQKKTQLDIIKKLETSIMSKNPQKIFDYTMMLNNMLPSVFKLYFNSKHTEKNTNDSFCPDCGLHIDSKNKILKKQEPFFGIPVLSMRRVYVRCSKCNVFVDTGFREYYAMPPDITYKTTVHENDVWWSYMKNLLSLLSDRLLAFHECNEDTLVRMLESSKDIKNDFV